MNQTFASTAPLQPNFFHTLRTRLIFSVAMVHVVLMGFFTWEAVDRQSHDLRQELYNKGNSLASLMAVATTNALLAEDLASLAEITRRVGRQVEVVYGEIVDIRGNVMASTRDGNIGEVIDTSTLLHDSFPLDETDLVLDLYETLNIGDRTVGYVMIGLSTQGLNNALVDTRNKGIRAIVLALIIGSVVAWLLSMTLTRNLHELTQAAGRIGGGDLSVRVTEHGKDETGVLARAFNLMVQSLHRSAREIEKEHKKRTDAERLACVGEMAASIAHEIRNPMAALINSVKLLDNQQLLASDRSEVTNIVNMESQRLQRILNDFLAFSRLPKSQIEQQNLADIINETLHLILHDPIYKPSFSINTSFDEELNCYCDRDQIRQVFFNLVINALQAMGDEGSLTITARVEGHQVNIHVEDNGKGIAEPMISEITKPFVTGRKGGTGLGLSVVQRILVQHDSTLTITSEPGKGTRASFELMTIKE